LSDYDYATNYEQGRKNVVADALSRKREMNAMSSVEVPLLERVKQAYNNDYIAREILRGNDNNYTVKNGLIYDEKNRVFIPDDKQIKQEIMNECHDVPTAGHMGMNKTFLLVTRHYIWRRIAKEIDEYVKTCDMCQSNKSSNHLKNGLLQPIDIPAKKWQTMTMDLITHLPKTKKGNDAIVVMVDKLTKTVRFAACKTAIDAPGLAKIVMREWVRVHGVPNEIISDRDARFTARFWKALWKELGTKLSMSTAYHPQSDGQTERANRTLEEMLRAYVNYKQDDWDEHLLAAEIATNNATQASTGYSPFFLANGTHMNLPITNNMSSNNPTAEEALIDMNAALERARTNLTAAQERQKKAADERRRDERFEQGDKVWLSTENLQVGERARKLVARRIGPYTVKRKIGDNAYELDLPRELSRLHPVFHVSKLERYHDGSASFPHREQQLHRPPPELDNDEQEIWEVEKIVDKRTRYIGRGRNKQASTQYMVKWKGYSDFENTWEPIDHLHNAQQAVREFERSSAN